MVAHHQPSGDPARGPTASGEEIARFSRLAEAWWDPHGEFRPLHQLNPVRVAYIRDAVARHFDLDPSATRPLGGLSVIDIGCGGGLVAEALTRLGARLTGIDASAESVHVADLDRFVEACAALRTPSGVMVFATLNRTLKSLALAKVGAEYILRWLPVGTHDWRKFLRPSELAAILRRHGLDVSDVTGVTYDPLRRSWSLSRDLSVNYMGVAV